MLLGSSLYPSASGWSQYLDVGILPRADDPFPPTQPESKLTGYFTNCVCLLDAAKEPPAPVIIHQNGKTPLALFFEFRTEGLFLPDDRLHLDQIDQADEV